MEIFVRVATSDWSDRSLQILADP